MNKQLQMKILCCIFPLLFLVSLLLDHIKEPYTNRLTILRTTASSVTASLALLRP